MSLRLTAQSFPGMFWVICRLCPGSQLGRLPDAGAAVAGRVGGLHRAMQPTTVCGSNGTHTKFPATGAES
jgi:hypothetical protein